MTPQKIYQAKIQQNTQGQLLPSLAHGYATAQDLAHYMAAIESATVDNAGVWSHPVYGDVYMVDAYITYDE